MRLVAARLSLAAAALWPAAALAMADLPVFTDPAAAIAAAESAPGHGIKAEVTIHVVSTGRGRHGSFLNSAADYHDLANLSIMFPPGTADAIAKAHGGSLDALIGHRVTVRGIITRVPISEIVSGRASGRGYYQHDVIVRTAAGIVAVR